MVKKENIWQRILDFLQRYDPERLSRKIQKSLEKTSEEAAKVPMTQEEERRTEYLLNFVFALSFFVFIYLMYKILF